MFHVKPSLASFPSLGSSSTLGNTTNGKGKGTLTATLKECRLKRNEKRSHVPNGFDFHDAAEIVDNRRIKNDVKIKCTLCGG
ncbi:hypothetical protein H5410_058407 [Solanum commersonii]|uniref:Uncharacterized protein n=1 Tax=Solanum commersonii TaxID=4109 RepID=A0A9J5WQZ8_SOLCO|nr:hypothetical protein H5410_058407 [Solanum commersonii]